MQRYIVFVNDLAVWAIKKSRHQKLTAGFLNYFPLGLGVIICSFLPKLSH
jgi:hypothetical protein